MAERGPQIKKSDVHVALVTGAIVLATAASSIFNPSKAEKETPADDPQPAVATAAGQAALNCLESTDNYLTLNIDLGGTRATTVATPDSENPTNVVAQEHGNEDVRQVQVRAAGNITPFSGVRDDGEQARWIAPGTYAAAVFGEEVTITVGCDQSSALTGAAEVLDRQLQEVAD